MATHLAHVGSCVRCRLPGNESIQGSRRRITSTVQCTLLSFSDRNSMGPVIVPFEIMSPKRVSASIVVICASSSSSRRYPNRLARLAEMAGAVVSCARPQDRRCCLAVQSTTS